MKDEESPDVSKRNMERDLKILQQISRTPKGKKIGLDDLHLLGLHRDCSPNAYGSSQDKLEVGWGDSPEPLNIEQKSKLHTTPVSCKKRLEARESPKSRWRNIRPSVRPPSKPPVDVAKYVAEVQALSKKIMNEIENDKQGTSPLLTEKKDNFGSDTSESAGDAADLFNSDDVTNEYLIACSQSLESRLGILDSGKQRKLFSAGETNETGENQKQLTDAGSDSAFEKVLQSFIAEEDDWLSQVVLAAEAKITPRKKGLVKTKSENELSSPDRCCKNEASVTRRSTGMSASFRRTYSSGIGGSSDYSNSNPSSNDIVIKSKTYPNDKTRGTGSKRFR